MGLNTGSNAGTIYLKVADGKIRQKAAEDIPGATKRVTKMTQNGEEVEYVNWEMVYDDLDGFITGIAKQTHDTFGDSYNFYIQDGADKFCIQLGAKSQYFRTLAELLPNIDLTKEVKLAPYSMQQTGSEFKNQGITIKQDGNKVANYYKTFDKTLDPPANVHKNGIEEFDTRGIKDKDEKAILKINLFKFLRASVEEIAKGLEEYKADNPTWLTDMSESAETETKEPDVDAPDVAETDEKY